MQSGYGTAEIHQQQFMADDCCPSAFFISNPNPHKQNHHLLHYHHHHQYQQQHPQQRQQQQQHISISHQLFEHPNLFQDFQEQPQRKLHHNISLGPEAGIETVVDCGTPTLPFVTVNCKLGLNENNGNREGVLNEEEEEDGLLRGNNEQRIPDGRPNSIVMPHCWQPQEDSAIKQPLWKPSSAELFNRNNKRCNEGEEEEEPEGIRNKHSMFSEHVNGKRQGKGLEKKYTHFGELEAIYGPTLIRQTNQTGSGSDWVYHGSETSVGEEASLGKTEKRKRKRKMRDQSGSMGGFFERLVKQLMDHQESLHRKFLGLIGKMDQERIKREEAWRCEEAAKYNREAIARAQEQALASSREAAIVSCLEKITGQSINLPIRNSQFHFKPEIPKEPIQELRHNISTNNRWPKAEVEALIQARSSLELKFQEPGLKGPLWEEISTLMGSMGYIRSSKRCKEKWENINKYFRKTKESAKKRSHISKTCPYFDQLDQLYSRSVLITGSSSYCYRPSLADDLGVQMIGNSELLDAIYIGNDLGIAQNPSIENFKVGDMGPLKLDFDGHVDEQVQLQQRSHGKQKVYTGEDVDEGEDLEDNEEEEEEEEGGDDGGGEGD